MNSSALNFAYIFICPHTTLHTDKLGQLTSDTRPSRFSACNIEKLGMGLGTRLLIDWVYVEKDFEPALFIRSKVHPHCIENNHWCFTWYRDLQVGWGTVAELKVTQANIIDHNTVHICSLENQLCTSYGYQLQLLSLNLPANLCNSPYSYSDVDYSHEMITACPKVRVIVSVW